MEFTTKQQQYLVAAFRAAPANSDFDYRLVAGAVGLSESEADDLTAIFRRAGLFDGIKRKMRLTQQGREIARRFDESNRSMPGVAVETAPDRLLLAIYRRVRRDYRQEVNIWLLGQQVGFSEQQSKELALELADLGWITLGIDAMCSLTIDGRREAERMESQRLGKRVGVEGDTTTEGEPPTLDRVESLREECQQLEDRVTTLRTQLLSMDRRLETMRNENQQMASRRLEIQRMQRAELESRAVEKKAELEQMEKLLAERQGEAESLGVERSQLLAMEIESPAPASMPAAHPAPAPMIVATASAAPSTAAMLVGCIIAYFNVMLVIWLFGDRIAGWLVQHFGK